MIKIKFFGAFLVLAAMLAACSDSANTNTETTVEEDITNIETSLDNTIDMMSNLEDGQFSSALKTFTGASAGDYTSEDWIEDVFSGLEDFIDVESTEDNRRFDFAAHAGVYTYNSSSNSWSESSSSGSIVLEFPSSQSSTTNDMAFTISEYQDASVNVDGENYWLPTRIQSELTLSGEAIFRFNLNQLEYSDDPDLPLPTTLDWELYTAPFTYSLQFVRNSGTNFVLNWNIRDGENLVTGLEVEADLVHDDFSNFEAEDLENLSGSVMLTSNLAVEYDIEYGTLVTIDDPTEAQINSLITAEVKYNNALIGELEYSEEEGDIMIIYKDGTSESASRYYEDFAEQFESVFYPFTGDWVEF